MMKKISCLIIVLLWSGHWMAWGQTNVTGGIYSNTSWTLAGSPYIVTDTVKIFTGVTLTIQPGVVIKYNSPGFIDVDGNLNAIGTPSDSIIFTSNSTSPYRGIYRGIQIDVGSASFSYCRFSYAYGGIGGSGSILSHCSFISNFYGTGAWAGPIDSCLFQYDSTGALGAGLVTGCTFIHNGTALSSVSGPVTYCIFSHNTFGVGGSNLSFCTFDSNYTAISNSDHITNCDIQFNQYGISGSGPSISFNNISNNYVGLYAPFGDSITCNTICNNTSYNVIAGGRNVGIPDNYWCLPDSASIQATIYDAYQNFNDGFVYFTPFDTVACVNTTGIKEIAINVDAINVYPNPSSGIFTLEGMENFVSTIEISNILGEKVYSKSYQPIANGSQTETIDLRNQPSGVYFYMAIGVDGIMIVEGKIVVAK